MRDLGTLVHERAQPHRGIEAPEDRLGNGQTGDHAGLLEQEARLRELAGGDDRVRGEVTFPDVLGEGEGDHAGDRVVGEGHGRVQDHRSTRGSLPRRWTM